MSHKSAKRWFEAVQYVPFTHEHLYHKENGDTITPEKPVSLQELKR